MSKITLTPEIYFDEVPKSLDMSMRTELHHVNEFTLAVAVILSAQATDKKVNEVTPELFKIASTPSEMFILGEDGLKKHIRVISFFNNKATNIIKLSKILAENYNGELPKSRDELMKLPGIGQKTANVVCNVLWCTPHIGVDTHVFRNAHRYGWVNDSDNTPEKVEKKLMKLIPEKYHGIANHTMVMHGRYICKAIKPKCADCPVAQWCRAKEKVKV